MCPPQSDLEPSVWTALQAPNAGLPTHTNNSLSANSGPSRAWTPSAVKPARWTPVMDPYGTGDSEPGPEPPLAAYVTLPPASMMQRDTQHSAGTGGGKKNGRGIQGPR